LVQFRTSNSLCRRCHADLDAVPEPPPAPVLAPLPALSPEPGIETAEATGVPVPDVAAAIRSWRQHRGLSQRQLAARMHVPRTYVSKIENDKATPTLASLERVAAAMDTRITSLLGATAECPAPETATDAFLAALSAVLPQLEPIQLSRLLEASRRLAQA